MSKSDIASKLTRISDKIRMRGRITDNMVTIVSESCRDKKINRLVLSIAQFHRTRDVDAPSII